MQLAADSALSRYRDLGLAEWAMEQAASDASKSIRALQRFFAVSRLTWDLSPNEEKRLQSYYTNLWMSGNFVPLFKWATAVPLAQMSGIDVSGTKAYVELPPHPSCIINVSPLPSPLGSIFPHSCGPMKVLRARLHEKTSQGRPTTRARALAWSLLGSKAMFPAMWLDKVASNLADHAAALSSLPPPLSKRTSRLLSAIGKTIGRRVATKYAHEHRIVKLSELPRPRLSSAAGWVKMYDADSHRVTTMAGTRSAVHQRLTGGLGGAGVGQSLRKMDYNPRVGVHEYHQIEYEFNWADWDFSPKVSIVALQEPFKIRTISIADGPTTAAASPLQKAWHGVMREMKPFQLIGGERVASAVEEDIAVLKPGYGWVSGDYSAATDKLSSRASKVMLDGLLHNVALGSLAQEGVSVPVLRRRIETSLLSAELDYSRTLEAFKGKSYAPKELLDSISLPPLTQQRNGQLMGNILSFPILCLVNITGYLVAHLDLDPEDMDEHELAIRQKVERALERGYFAAGELDSLPLLVNGDDILFQARPALYEAWLRVVKELGLVPSLGKNYYSDEFFTVNSELYTADGYTSRPWWGAFETELVRLRNELKFETGEDVLTADLRSILPKMQHFLRETVKPKAWPVANKEWLCHLHSSGILEPYKGLNWFLPTTLGGMGLDSAGFDSTKTTYAQQKLMARAALDPDGFARFMVSVETSLLNDANLRRLRKSQNSWWIKGEKVKSVEGRLFVVDKEVDGYEEEVPLKAYELVSSVVQHSSHIDSWLDYHITGVRLDLERVKESVRRMLTWGLRLSDKHLSEEYEEVERYQCVRAVTFLARRDGEYKVMTTAQLQRVKPLDADELGVDEE